MHYWRTVWSEDLGSYEGSSPFFPIGGVAQSALWSLVERQRQLRLKVAWFESRLVQHGPVAQRGRVKCVNQFFCGVATK